MPSKKRISTDKMTSKSSKSKDIPKKHASTNTDNIKHVKTNTRISIADKAADIHAFLESVPKPKKVKCELLGRLRLLESKNDKFIVEHRHKHDGKIPSMKELEKRWDKIFNVSSEVRKELSHLEDKIEKTHNKLSRLKKNKKKRKELSQLEDKIEKTRKKLSRLKKKKHDEHPQLADKIEKTRNKLSRLKKKKRKELSQLEDKIEKTRNKLSLLKKKEEKKKKNGVPLDKNQDKIVKIVFAYLITISGQKCAVEMNHCGSDTVNSDAVIMCERRKVLRVECKARLPTGNSYQIAAGGLHVIGEGDALFCFLWKKGTKKDTFFTSAKDMLSHLERIVFIDTHEFNKKKVDIGWCQNISLNLEKLTKKIHGYPVITGDEKGLDYTNEAVLESVGNKIANWAGPRK